MTTVAVIVSDRPPDLYLRDCHDNLNQYLPVDVHVHVVDDTEHRLGMAGAVRAAWAWALEQDADYLLHVEEDFRFIDLPLRAMQFVLERHQHLAQVVLKRQPWSDEEKRAGGQMETNPTVHPVWGARPERSLGRTLDAVLAESLPDTASDARARMGARGGRCRTRDNRRLPGGGDAVRVLRENRRPGPL